MENFSRRQKFLFWLIRNATNWWLWLPVMLVASALVSFDIAGLGGLGLVLWGSLAFAAGIDFALEAILGKNYTVSDIKKKSKEKKNDTTH